MNVATTTNCRSFPILNSAIPAVSVIAYITFVVSSRSFNAILLPTTGAVLRSVSLILTLCACENAWTALKNERVKRRYFFMKIGDFSFKP